uniref:Uridylate-specific endoribonuclease n=1 Tax=Homo sapiens TaxID=9606 RepID=B7Z7N4_HUMAN|nr:unnamed protein product [Homo sapiens]
MKTAVMKELYSFLHHQNRYGSEQEFVDDLKNMWFGLYSRGNEEGDSSGFEHVFSGEVKKGKVTGFHNWIRFYLEEKEGLVDYYSHIYDGPVPVKPGRISLSCPDIYLGQVHLWEWQEVHRHSLHSVFHLIELRARKGHEGSCETEVLSSLD